MPPKWMIFALNIVYQFQPYKTRIGVTNKKTKKKRSFGDAKIIKKKKTKQK